MRSTGAWFQTLGVLGLLTGLAPGRPGAREAVQEEASRERSSAPARVRAPGARAFPGAEGFGAETRGGRGGRVLFVTTLHDSGPGSLRHAVQTKGPRVVLFRTSGVIELESHLDIEEPYLTLAGQSAPGSGVCLKNYSVRIRKTREVIIRHLRFRPGDERKKPMDALSVLDATNVVLDHCSFSWGSDETLSVTGASKNITVQWCIIAESLNRSFHPEGAHGYGSLIEGKGGITFHHNIYAHHASRNPRPKSGSLDFRNNVIYDWGRAAGYNNDDPSRINYVSNYLKPGPSTVDKEFAFTIFGGKKSGTRIFVQGNLLEGFPAKSADNWEMVRLPGRGAAPEVHRAPELFPAPEVRTDPTAEAYKRVLAEAGATLPRRDPADARVVEQVRAGAGRIIDSQRDVGGWTDYRPLPAPADQDADGMPDAWEVQHQLNPGEPADFDDDPDGDGYANLEEFLNGTAPARPD